MVARHGIAEIIGCQFSVWQGLAVIGEKSPNGGNAKPADDIERAGLVNAARHSLGGDVRA
jgi:hypothetical protein